MKTYKVTCDVSNSDRGRHQRDVFVPECPSENVAELMAKIYFLEGIEGYNFHGIVKVSKIS